MEAPDSGVVHVPLQHTSGSNIVDEIPVDVVANLILLHPVHGITGVVRAGAQSYVPRSLSHLHADIRTHLPLSRDVPPIAFRYVSDTVIEEGRYARFRALLGRDWRFLNRASRHLVELKGPLSIPLEDHDTAEFMATRARIIAEGVISRRRSKL
ncbi:hypothetical protein DFH09DRAFT_1308383 [Mycena vulgaris]|nr:hypothetical protein DFH09DRAFT_1308383 [Mycena vulgaris]